ncbi:contact-dependent growth inhibition system immunity protein [Ramlibacter sp. AN1015]|uniref:contact-dependent growth inhibition system immunity protein n=1 Tax=Ramlibacter sp. AN1015 TaxID=3133428 RepID=UPI0030C11742
MKSLNLDSRRLEPAAIKEIQRFINFGECGLSYDVFIFEMREAKYRPSPEALELIKQAAEALGVKYPQLRWVANNYGIPDAMKADEFKELRSFLSGYFHEDWDLEASGPREVVAQFLGSAPNSCMLEAIVAQIYRYVGEHEDGNELERALIKDLGCYYLPSGDGVDAGAWLKSLASELKKAVS